MSEKAELYQSWIASNVQEENPRGLCRAKCEQMVEEFPELKMVRGHVTVPAVEQWADDPHWWLLTPDGEVVDPTARQFPQGCVVLYDPWDESQPEPTGVCPNCGGYCFEGGTCCSDECHNAYAAYCMGGLR